MAADCFLDTNVLVYAAYPAADEAWKQDIALKLLADTRFATSSQVLLEFYQSTTRKRKPGLSLADARFWLGELAHSPVVALDAEMILEAVDLAERYKIVFWDGAILVAAARSGARVVYTEDLNHGQFYGPVQVLNPFRRDYVQ
jgi:predicted nucleic acid-binding protein